MAAITSAVAGTTRDIIEVRMDLSADYLSTLLILPVYERAPHEVESDRN